MNIHRRRIVAGNLRRDRLGASLRVESLEPRLLLAAPHMDDCMAPVPGAELLGTGPFAAISLDGREGDDQTSIIYDAATGGVSVDVALGVELTSVNLVSAAGIFTGDPAENLGGPFDIDNDATVFKATFGSSFGSIGFGNVAQPYLDVVFLINDLSVDGSVLGNDQGLGDVDFIYIPPLLAPNGQRNDDQTSILYDAATGRVEVEVPAEIELTSIALESAAGIFTEEPAENLDGPFDRHVPNVLFKGVFGDSFGSLSFGNVAQTGLSEQFLLHDISVLGSRAGGGGLGRVDLVFVRHDPTISNIDDRVTEEDTPTGPIAFTIGDLDTPADSLTVTATSNDQTLVPDANILVGGTGSDRILSITPAENEHGSATITVSVGDERGATTSEQFILTVVPVNDPPEVAPSGEIDEVQPNPRAASVEEIAIVFDQEVIGFDLSDLMLTRSRDETVSLLPGLATLTTSDNTTWILGNLRSLSAPSGVYSLTLVAAGANITNTAGTPLATGDTVKWINGAGDADSNNAFDQIDLIRVLQSGKYLTGQRAAWSEGDWNGDGLFNQFDIILTQQTQPPHYRQGPLTAVVAGSHQPGMPPDAAWSVRIDRLLELHSGAFPEI